MKRLLLALLLLAPCVVRADEIVQVGTTSVCHDIFVSDSSSSTGAGLTGLAYNSGSLTCYYFRNETGTGETATSITLATSTLGTYTSGAFKEISSTNMPGHYEFCPPNAAYASGARAVMFQCKGATNMAPMNLRVVLTAAYPEVIIKDGTGPGEIDTNAGKIVTVVTTENGGGGGASNVTRY